MPVMAKFRVRRARAQPFLAGGYAFRVRHGGETYVLDIQKDIQGRVISVIESRQPTTRETDNGLVVAAGIETPWDRSRFGAELRYTRWLGLETRPFAGGGLVRLNPNQVEILVFVRL
jgi:hypothetical protein